MLNNTIRRIERTAELTSKARRLGVSPWAILDPSWRSAVRITSWDLIPPPIRSQIRTVCDIGANKGEWMKGVLRLSSPESIVAVEPNPTVFAKLHERFSKTPNIRLFNCAVGEREGTAEFHAHEHSELSSLRELGKIGKQLHDERGANYSMVKVELKKVDDLVIDIPEITLMKIDVQGYEREVLAGGVSALNKCKCLIIEVLYEARYYEGAAPFLPLAQQVEAVSPLRLNAVTAPALSPDGFGAWADAIFVSADVLEARGFAS